MLDMVPVCLGRVVTLLGLPVRRVQACHCLSAHLRSKLHHDFVCVSMISSTSVDDVVGSYSFMCAMVPWYSCCLSLLLQVAVVFALADLFTPPNFQW